MRQASHRVVGEITESDEDRFWAKVNQTRSCWEWTAAKSAFGHGRFRLNGHLLSPHRIAWVLLCGKIPPGMLILHKCDNPSCVRPKHLYLGTHSDNLRDALKRGRKANPSVKKLTDDQVRHARQEVANGRSHRSVAKSLSVSHSTIDRVINREYYTHVI